MSLPTQELSRVLDPIQASSITFQSPSEDWRIVDIDSFGPSYGGSCRILLDLSADELVPGTTLGDVSARIWTGSTWQRLPTAYFAEVGVVEVHYAGPANTLLLASDTSAAQVRGLDLDVLSEVSERPGVFECEVIGQVGASWTLLLGTRSTVLDLSGQTIYIQPGSAVSALAGVIMSSGVGSGQFSYPAIPGAQGMPIWWQAASISGAQVLHVSNPYATRVY